MTNPELHQMGVGNVLACPRCLSPEFLGQYVTGWRELREPPRMIEGRVVMNAYGSVYDAECVAYFCSNRGCNVDQEIPEGRVVQLDATGKPVITPPKEQECLDV